MPKDSLARTRRTAWNRGVDEHPASVFFHRADWLDALEQAYPRFRARHRLLERQGAGRAVGIAPAFALWSPLTGRRLTSQPFNFYGGPLATDADTLDHLLRDLHADARSVGARVLDIRTTDALPAELAKQYGLLDDAQYLRHVVSLTGADPRSRYVRRFRERMRALEREGTRSGLEIRALQGPADLDALHDVMVEANGRRHATLAQPRRFLRILFARLGPAGAVRGLGLFEGGRMLGGIVIGHHGTQRAYLFGAASMHAQASSPIARLLDRALEQAVGDGATCFDLGITSRRHSGLAQFKTRFGAEEMPLYFYRRALRGRLGRPSDYHASMGAIRPVVRRLPKPVLAAASALAAGWLA